MKSRVSAVCLVLLFALLGLYLTVSNKPAADSRSANNNAATPNPTVSPNEMNEEVRVTRNSTTDESQTAEDCLVTGKPFHAGNIKIISVNHQENDDGFEYPQIAEPSTQQERAFNRYILRFIAPSLKDYKKCIRDEGCEDGWYGFSESYVTPEIVSVRFSYKFSPGIGGTRIFDTLLNYDLKAGKPIKGLGDLFKPKSEYTKRIADYVESELRRCEYTSYGLARSFWNDTTSKLGDYDGWQLTRDGVEIILPTNQIGRIGYNLKVLVPYDRLQGVLRQDASWFGRLGNDGGEATN